MQMYFNNHSMWSVVYGGGRTLRLTEADGNVRLFLAQVRVTPSIYRELVDDMKTGIVSYPTVRGEIRTYSYANPERYLECNNPLRNQLPNRVIVALLRQDAFNGDAARHPPLYGPDEISHLSTALKSQGGAEKILRCVHHEQEPYLLFSLLCCATSQRLALQCPAIE